MSGPTDAPTGPSSSQLLATPRNSSQLLALSETAGRAARASWSQIGPALGTSKQAAREAHSRWIDAQAEAYGKSGQMGFDETDVAEARVVAGEPEDR